jgi:hypothetical protein
MRWYCSKSTHCLVNGAGLLWAVEDGRGAEREKSDYLSENHAGSLNDWFVDSFLYYMEAGTIITLGNANYPFPSQIIIQH